MVGEESRQAAFTARVHRLQEPIGDLLVHHVVGTLEDLKGARVGRRATGEVVLAVSLGSDQLQDALGGALHVVAHQGLVDVRGQSLFDQVETEARTVGGIAAKRRGGGDEALQLRQPALHLIEAGQRLAPDKAFMRVRRRFVEEAPNEPERHTGEAHSATVQQILHQPNPAVGRFQLVVTRHAEVQMVAAVRNHVQPQVVVVLLDSDQLPGTA